MQLVCDLTVDFVGKPQIFQLLLARGRARRLLGGPSWLLERRSVVAGADHWIALQLRCQIHYLRVDLGIVVS